MHQKIEYFILFGILIVSSGVQAEHLCSQWLAKIISSQGKVDIQYAGQSDWKTVNSDQTFCDNDKIRTRKHSRATLLLRNESRATLKQSSTLIFLPPEQKTSSWYLKLLEGASFFRSREPQRLNIQTPFINAVHQGTEFLVTVDSEHAEIKVFDGQVAANNKQGEIQIKQGFTGVAYESQTPQVKALAIRPEDAVQWTLYYPPVINIEKGRVSKLNADDNQQQIGNLDKSLNLLDKNQDLQNDSHHLTYIASLLLSVGSVDEALKFIDQAQTLEPGYSDALALRAIISVVKNRQDEALNFAQKATTQNPQSATAQIALSYAYQSKFKIESALEATQKAVELSPDNALAWARLSELQLSTGERSDALKSAQKAQQLNPKLDRTQTILGFAYLAEVDIDEANTAFTKSINLNSADPLARLGLGLAKIRKGDIEEGTQDLETAVSLDPDNAIMRSYLGKAYYELKNDGYAETELIIAKEVDPNDPTPWFYDAIRKQTTNRPVEALHDMQKAIELNDNRGVYRSKLLLDEDFAARSASLGRIYNDLGFQQRGLLEGWKSVSTDQKNYSAHRLLADNYAAIPRHEIARVSELLQSQLLQPINITPIQPSLAESNSLLLGASGPSSQSFNEFNSLFTRNRFAFQASGIYGSNNTFGNEVTHSGVWGNFSYSLGQFHHETDGFWENNGSTQDIYNAFIQSSLSQNLQIQAEFRHSDIEHGDLVLHFDPGDFDQDFQRSLRQNNVRIGSRYQFSKNSSLIASAVYQDGVERQIHGPQKSVIEFNSRGYIGELQYQFNSSKINSTVGGGFYNLDQNINGLLDADARHGNGYIYNYFRLPYKINLTLGLSYDSLNDDRIGKFNLINPKFGILWNLTKNTTLRIGAFRTLKRSLLSDQTIEPTQISGFNQLFDDNDGTEAKRYGIGIDQKFSQNLYAGFEFSKRELKVPFILRGGDIMKDSRTEELYRAYLNWTPHPSLAFAINYKFEKFKRKNFDGQSDGLPRTDTHFLPINLRYFHPSGIFGGIDLTYVNQRVLFFSPGSGQNDFSLVDLSLGYRLPKRYGIVSINLQNLFDTDFHYQGLGLRTKQESREAFAPERTISARVTFSF